MVSREAVILSLIFLFLSILVRIYLLDFTRDISKVDLAPFIIGVLRGTWNCKPVIIKSIGKYNEWQVVESESKGFPRRDRGLVHEKILEALYTPHEGSITAKLHICPEVKNLTELFNHLYQFGRQPHRVWTALRVNPEPLVLQIIQPPKWLVPAYYGSCGRLIMVEDCGETLYSLRNSPLESRLKWAVELLDMAFQFTNFHPQFSFYFTDWSPDNIAVHKKVKFVDLEHVIMLNKSAGAHLGHLEHKSKHADCKGCMYFSPHEICSHRVSDHNVYAVCKEILSSDSIIPGGLLHSLPPDLSSYALPTLIQQCVQPSAISSRRFVVAQELKRVLNLIISDF